MIQELAQDLQADLNKVTKWVSDNKMAFNEKKIELLRYGNNTHLKTTQYLVGNQKIEEKTSVRDLGVQVNNDFQFAAHFGQYYKDSQTNGWLGAANI